MTAYAEGYSADSVSARGFRWIGDPGGDITLCMLTLPPEPVMFDAVARNDAGFEGVFYLAVKTTGIFCRPTCSARTPRPENVEYFATTADAVHAGYRACRRCRPTEEDGLSPRWIGRLHEEMDRRSGSPISDDDLQSMGVDPGTVRRAFKRRYEMTFQSYQRARRMGLALMAIRRGDSVAHAAHDHGFASESGFREAFERTFGTTPGRAGDVACLFSRWIDTPLGAMLGVTDDEGLRLLEFVDRAALPREMETLRRRLRAVIVPGEHGILDRTESMLDHAMHAHGERADVPIAPLGSDFQRAVWDRLRAIPVGETATYADIAADLGRRGGERAVGNACGANTIAVVIPCHRVVRRDGSLGGYAGGLWRKRRLLELERAGVVAETG